MMNFNMGFVIESRFVSNAMQLVVAVVVVAVVVVGVVIVVILLLLLMIIAYFPSCFLYFIYVS
jgi:hypothetical protein